MILSLLWCIWHVHVHTTQLYLVTLLLQLFTFYNSALRGTIFTIDELARNSRKGEPCVGRYYWFFPYILCSTYRGNISIFPASNYLWEMVTKIVVCALIILMYSQCGRIAFPMLLFEQRNITETNGDESWVSLWKSQTYSCRLFKMSHKDHISLIHIDRR